MEPPFYVYPPGLEKIVTYMKERYNNTPMFITENGEEIDNDAYPSYHIVNYSFPFCETNAMVFRLLWDQQTQLHRWRLSKWCEASRILEKLSGFSKDSHQVSEWLQWSNSFKGFFIVKEGLESANCLNSVYCQTDIWFISKILIRKGADVRGYFLWTLLDSFEWTNGYTKRYGIHHVDHSTLKITPKKSAAWYRQFIAQHRSIKASVSEDNPQLSQY